MEYCYGDIGKPEWCMFSNECDLERIDCTTCEDLLHGRPVVYIRGRDEKKHCKRDAENGGI